MRKNYYLCQNAVQMVSELVDKYLWLIQLLIDAGERGMTLTEIEDRYEDRYRAPYPRRTFNNHREQIASLFGVEIICDRNSNRYKVASGDRAVDARQSVDWLVNTFTVNNMLNLGKERLSGRVSVEDIPSGHKFLVKILEAMTLSREIVLVYRKYNSPGHELLHVHPYAVKEFARRWYVTGYCVERDAERVYGMDRIEDVLYSGNIYKMPEYYDVEDAFKFSFGPYLPDSGASPQIIRIRTIVEESAYFKDLPLHPSQTLVSEDADGCVFRYYLIPTNNFVMELCRYGGRIEVLEPVSLRERVIEYLKNALSQYENC